MSGSANEIVVHSQAGVHDVEALVQAAVSVLTNDMQIPTHDQSQVTTQQDQNTVQLLVDTTTTNIQDRLYMCTDCNLAFYGEQGEQEWQWHLRQHKAFKCDLCAEAFEQKESLKTHMRSHTMQMPYICDKCGSAYSLKSNLAQHMKSHDEKLYQCGDCHVVFKSQANLEKHMKFHTGETIKVFQCEQCSKTFGQHKNLVQHMKIHQGGEKTYKCSECPASYSYKCHLTRHLMIHTGDKPYKCKFCGKAFNRNAHLIRHRKIHSGADKEWKCQQCGFAFWEKSDLLRHVKSHEGNRPFQCNFCEQTFVWKRYLLKHLNNNHRAEDRVFCPDCCQCFDSEQSLMEHQATAHNDKKSLTHTCEVCGEEFYFKYKLDEHMFIHTGRKAHACEKCPQKFVSRKELDRHHIEHSQEVSFRCNTCEKTFSSIDQLQQHVKLHTGTGKYPCNFCGAAFRWKSQLTSHMVVHSTDYDFTCNVCSKQFKRKRDLTRHIKIYHDTKPPYTCTECNQDFHSPYNLHKHNSDVHWRRLDAGDAEFACTHCTGIFKVRQDLARHLLKVHPPRPYICKLCQKRFTMFKFLEKHFELKHEGEEMEENENYEVQDKHENADEKIGDDENLVLLQSAEGVNAQNIVLEEINGDNEEIAKDVQEAAEGALGGEVVMETDETYIIEKLEKEQQQQPISEAITLAHMSQQPATNVIPVYIKEADIKEQGGSAAVTDQQQAYDSEQQFIITTIDALNQMHSQVPVSVTCSEPRLVSQGSVQPQVITIPATGGMADTSQTMVTVPGGNRPTQMHSTAKVIRHTITVNNQSNNSNMKVMPMMQQVGGIGPADRQTSVGVGQIPEGAQVLSYSEDGNQIMAGLVAESKAVSDGTGAAIVHTENIAQE